MMRAIVNEEEAWAHSILDLIKAGGHAPSTTINRALWITGDAVGIDQFFNHPEMKLLHISEPRCAGRDLKPTPTICPSRQVCVRHQQLGVDRQLGIEGQRDIKTMALPFVAGNACHFFMPAS